MSKKQFKSQASSSRAVSGAFGSPDARFGSSTLGIPSIFGAVASSPLSYVYEPPDLSGISEPNVVVALKNLQKKDATTKAKALEDLQGFVLSLGADKGAVEDSILEAWIKIYPRLSIDSARRVRQLAHLLQGYLSVSCGKRIAKHMPKIVSPWLAGLYDNDKSVARAAQESFKQVFSSDEKMKNVWVVYQEVILEYSRNVIVEETINTLSDERTTSPDDAVAKYTRVVSTAIRMVTHAINENPSQIMQKQQQLYDDFLGQEKVWKLASNSDPFVRRSIYGLLIAALHKQKESLDVVLISRNILTSSLHINQAGSAFDYAKALSLLTISFPEVWTRHFSGSGKKSATKRLCQFLRKGSLGGPVEYWFQVSTLLSHIPADVLLAQSEEEAVKALDDSSRASFALLEAVHDGLISRDEPRLNQGGAWNVYLDICFHFQSILKRPEERYELLKSHVLPLLLQYLRPSQEMSNWTVPSLHQLSLCFRAFEQMVEGAPKLLEEEWHRLSNVVVADVRTSLPEQSKDYDKSQESVMAETGRWYNLQAAILEKDASDTVKSLLTSTLNTELDAIVATLRARKGKPYGAAAALETAITLLPKLILGRDDTQKIITNFFAYDVPDLLLSPSGPYCIDILNHLEGISDARAARREIIIKLRDAPESSAKSTSLQRLISSPSFYQAEEAELLNSVVKHSLQQAMTDDAKDWALVMAAMGNPRVPTELADDILSNMAEGLSMDGKRVASLQGLELTAKINGGVLRSFALSKDGSNLLSNLLKLSESLDEDLSRQAKIVSVAVDATLLEEKGPSHATRSLIEIIQKGIEVAGADSLSVESLSSQACKIWDQTLDQDKESIAAELLPDGIQLTAAFKPILAKPPNPSLAVTNGLGSAISLIEQPLASGITTINLAHDTDGYSAALRMMWYTLKITKTTEISRFVTSEQQAAVLKHVLLFLQLATDNVSVTGSNSLWDHYDPDLEAEILGLLTECSELSVLWLEHNAMIIAAQLLEEAHGSTTSSYYNARAYPSAATFLHELHKQTALDGEAEKLRTMRKSQEIFANAAYLESASDRKALSRLCNELISDLTGYDFHGNTKDAIRQLILLNCIIHSQEEDIVFDIPQQRLVFFVKHMDDALNNVELPLPIISEILKALTIVLPPIKEIYGSFWKTLLEVAYTTQTNGNALNDDDFPSLHARLRLLETLYRLREEGSNDDLEDAWDGSKELVASGLLSLLSQSQHLSDETHQPRKILHQLLARIMSRVPLDFDKEVSILYPILASESVALQTAVFKIMHQHIPAQQEQISFDKALSKDFKAKLPEELLSLIVAAPKINSLAEASFERTIPLSLRSYLLSWELVFDHWENASDKVKADYASPMKECAYLNDLLSFTFYILIDARSKPIDASKYNIESYTPNMEEQPEKETHWLLIHLYYLSLKYLPTLTRTWWRDSTSRQTQLAVESWTQKYISPLIIASELSTVSAWGPSQATAEAPLNIKVSPSAREITASIPVDETTMQIAIHLPPTYPLARATVDSVHRIGVDEKKWRSWLITTQGVINFSNTDSGEGGGGNLIDGLLAWRKNVTATMKGQTECAICYSVVAGDGQLPSKRCGTCRNLFHGSCLFRWFKSSNSSGCPLCRNAFNYG